MKSRNAAFVLLVHGFVLVVLLWTVRRHAERIGTTDVLLNWVFVASFVVLLLHALASLTNFARRPAGAHGARRSGDPRHTTLPSSRGECLARRVTVVIPVYNEDPAALVGCLRSLASQTHPAHRIHLVDDGSTDPGVVELAANAFRADMPGELLVSYQPNRGKRHAQSLAFSADPDAWAFVTIDSDTVLHPGALEAIAYGFADPNVTAVGGVLLGLNAEASLLTRLLDLGFTSSFLNGRAVWSRLGSVVVHCGGLAAYRADVVRRYHDYYVNQRVLGRSVSSGDDRMLTSLALLHGTSLTQESAVGYTLLPENLSHLSRQRVRWWRSFFWGSLWLIRNMPMNRAAWWLVAYQLVAFATYFWVAPVVLLVVPLLEQRVPWELFVYLGLLGYLRSVRYVSVRRPGERYSSRLLTYALSPLSTCLHIYLCTVLQYVGLFTMRSVSWGTRDQVEVGVGDGLRFSVGAQNRISQLRPGGGSQAADQRLATPTLLWNF